MSGRIVIIQKFITEYRRDFYESLKERCEDGGVEFKLMIGNPDRVEATKEYDIYFPWAIFEKNRILGIKGRFLYWQPLLKHLKKGDVVVVEHASKLLFNYLLHALHAVGYIKLCYWGHGNNFQSHDELAVARFVKAYMAKSVHWWFGYTQLSSVALEAVKFPAERTTIVQNAINTDKLKQSAQAIEQSQLDALRLQIGIPEGAQVAIYVGSMYSIKRIAFLIESCRKIKAICPDFHVIFIGKGVDAPKVDAFCQSVEWGHYLGAIHGDDKIAYIKLAKCMLMPGAMGLAVLDSFAVEVPMVTSKLDYHGPEIDYLQHLKNGVMVEEAQDAEVYAKAVTDVLMDDVLHQQLVQGCKESAQHYTIENMVENFYQGFVSARKNSTSPDNDQVT